VQSIGAEYEVEATCRTVTEGGFDALSVVGERRDSDTEAVIDVRPHGFVNDAGQVTPEDLHLTAENFGG
jgi:hypothetical protein